MEGQNVRVDILFKEFKGLESYRDKLKFFDEHFTLLPFVFPPFNAQLDFLLTEDGLEALTKILERERRKSFDFIKRSYYNGDEFIFDVYPHNNRFNIVNDYIVNIFTQSKEFADLKLKIKTASEVDKASADLLVVEVNNLIERIKGKIIDKKDRTFRKQLFKVFYIGFVDYSNGGIKTFHDKKKFTELYLYSTGVLFAQYKEALLERVYKQEAQLTPVPQDSMRYTLFKAKVLLLNELGVTQFLREKYKNSDEINVEQKIAELYCTITGEDIGLIRNILDYI